MGSLPRPLLAVLIAVIAAAAAWLVVFKPSSSSVNAPSPAAVQSAVAQGAAHATPKKAAAATAHPATRPAAHRSAKPHAAKTAAHSAVTARTRVAEVDAALADDQVLAVLFYNPSAADDQAAASEVAAIPSHHGQVVRVAVPISELSNYTPITAHVQVNGSPTLVVINRKHDAQTLVGYADQLEYDQLVVAALAAK
jgi:hypothetical protein